MYCIASVYLVIKVLIHYMYLTYAESSLACDDFRQP